MITVDIYIKIVRSPVWWRSLAPFSFKTRSNALRLDLLASTHSDRSKHGGF